MAVWIQYESATADLWAARYDPWWGWGDAALVKIGGSSTFVDPVDIAADGSGNFIALAVLGPDPVMNLWAFRYTAGEGWDGGQLLETNDTADVSPPRLAIAPDGSAIAVWAQHDGIRQNIWGSRFVPASGWTLAQLLETQDTGEAYSPSVAIDRAGNATVVWTQIDGVNNIWTNRFAPSTGWAGASELDTSSEEAVEAVIAANPQGGFMAAWTQSNGTMYNIVTRAYSDAGGWAAVAYGEFDDAGFASHPAVAFDGPGNAWLVFEQRLGGQYNGMVNWMPVGGGWVKEGKITDGPEESLAPDIVGLPGGSAVAMDMYWNGAGFYLVARTVVPLALWGPEQNVELDQPSVNNFDLGVGADGTVTAVWGASSTPLDFTAAARFVWPDVTDPPLLLTAPVDGAHTNQTALRIAGTTEPGATVFAGGVVAYVNAQGRFDFVVPLDPGLNTFAVVAEDASGNRAQVLLQVTFDDPTAGLEAELGLARTRLAGAEQGLEDANITIELLQQRDAQLTASDVDLRARVEAAASAAGAAALMGLLGLIVGLAGTAIALLSMRKGKGPRAPEQEETTKRGDVVTSSDDKPK